MKILTILSVLSLVTSVYSQEDPQKIYERARFEIAVNGHAAYACKIVQNQTLSSDEILDIEKTYLLKEGVFKVHFIDDNKTIEVFYFEPVNYEIVVDLAMMFFGDFKVEKPIQVGVRAGELYYKPTEMH